MDIRTFRDSRPQRIGKPIKPPISNENSVRFKNGWKKTQHARIFHYHGLLGKDKLPKTVFQALPPDFPKEVYDKVLEQYPDLLEQDKLPKTVC